MYSEDQARSDARSHEEVLEAVGRLTGHDFARLRVAAHRWIRDLRLDTVAADADDLVSEAVFRTTSGQRVWKAGVSLEKHLRGVMRSLADSWRKSAERRAASGRLEVRHSDFLKPDADEDAEESTPVSDATSPEPDAERVLIGLREFRALEAAFADDEVAGAVIDGLWAERTGPEIRAQWDLTEKQYAAAVRRIRRHANRKGGSRGD